MANASSYKLCFVPGCENTSFNSPNKLFFNVPVGEKRKLWCAAAGVQKELSLKSPHTCCQDHFNVEEDVDNLDQYHFLQSMGMKSRIRLKRNVLPHIFHCRQLKEPGSAVNVKKKKVDRDIGTSSSKGLDKNISCKKSVHGFSHKVQVFPSVNDGKAQKMVNVGIDSFKSNIDSSNNEMQHLEPSLIRILPTLSSPTADSEFKILNFESIGDACIQKLTIDNSCQVKLCCSRKPQLKMSRVRTIEILPSFPPDYKRPKLEVECNSLSQASTLSDSPEIASKTKSFLGKQRRRKQSF